MHIQLDRVENITHKKQAEKIEIWKYNERDSLS